jgi:ligand-binding SRPBCC domain-containing protein
MKLYYLNRKQVLPTTIEATWNFFTNPYNLEQITPPWLAFKITNMVSKKIYPGTIISYRLKTLFGMPTTWVTEITHVNKPSFFTDEMRLGPYLFWHHQHLFQEVTGGVEVEDIVTYALKFGYLGQMLHQTIVRAKLEEIFDYRRTILSNIF